MLAFVMSAGMTGVWGGFFAMYVGFIDPESMFSLTMSVQVVLGAILGGVGTLVGPWLGAAVLLPLSEGTRVLWGSSGLGLDLLIFGLAILLVTLFPVSYTHLDVYKRQPRGRWPSPPCNAPTCGWTCSTRSCRCACRPCWTGFPWWPWRSSWCS